MILCAVLFAAGGVLSLLTIRAPLTEHHDPGPDVPVHRPSGPGLHCGVGAPPLALARVPRRLTVRPHSGGVPGG